MIARITVNDVIPDEEPPSEIDPPPCDFQDTDEQESDEQTGMLLHKYYYYYYYYIIILYYVHVIFLRFLFRTCISNQTVYFCIATDYFICLV